VKPGWSGGRPGFTSSFDVWGARKKRIRGERMNSKSVLPEIFVSFLGRLMTVGATVPEPTNRTG
jgi:hypothetical protein